MQNSFERFNEIQMQASAETFAEAMMSSTMISNREELHRWLIKEILASEPSGLMAEFGVFEGKSINLFAEYLGRNGLSIHGFDAFEGIEENWDADRLKGRYSRKGKEPDVASNVQLHVGWVQDTLPGFLSANEGKHFSFIHLDMDTYTPTRFALELLVPRLTKGTVILFDELHGYPQWKAHEYKALQETLPASRYNFIAFGLQQAAIRILA